MPGAFNGIDLAGRALRSFQRALDTTGHNIANLDTPGYSRQTVDLQATEPTTFFAQGRQMLGSGVGISSVNRIRATFLDTQMRTAQSVKGGYDALKTELGSIEAAFAETGPNSISGSLDKFFNAWSGLASNPSEPASRKQVQIAGQDLADKVRGAYLGLSGNKAQLDAQVKLAIDDVNRLAENISQLNTEIRKQTAMGGPANDLMDQRDLALQNLSNLINIKTETFSDGTIAVFATQFTLVDSAGYRPYPKTYDAASFTTTDGTNVYNVRGGKLYGLFQSINAVNAQQSNLDGFANTLRTQVNLLHDVLPNPDVTQRFFNDSPIGLPQTGAIDFDLADPIKQDPSNILTGATTNAGDNSIALALSQLRDKTVASLGGRTFAAFHSGNMTGLAQRVQQVEGQAETQDAIVAQIDSQRQSISGVSVDDEMANMLRFQRSYQAAAKVLTIFDEVTQDLLAMLKR